MNDLERMHIEHACARLLARYALCLDTGAYDEFVGLFAADAVWTMQNTGPLRGHAAIRDYLTRRNPATRSRHVITNIVVEVSDADHAASRSYTTAYHYVGSEAVPPLHGPGFIAEARDTFRRTAEGWRIATREMTVVFKHQE